MYFCFSAMLSTVLEVDICTPEECPSRPEELMVAVNSTTTAEKNSDLEKFTGKMEHYGNDSLLIRKTPFLYYSMSDADGCNEM